jgi:hypothetical protein
MEREKHIIEIIGIGSNSVYSIGKINFTKEGDVYFINKTGDSGLHLSRHKDGNCHVRMKDKEIFKLHPKRVHINDFDGFEFIETWGFGIDSLSELYAEYNPNKCNAVVAINMRYFKGLAFNLGITLLTKNGIPQLMDMWQDFENRQVYICASTIPMVGIIFGAYKKKL